MNILSVADTRKNQAVKYGFLVHGFIDGDPVKLGFDSRRIADSFVRNQTNKQIVSLRDSDQ